MWWIVKSIDPLLLGASNHEGGLEAISNETHIDEYDLPEGLFHPHRLHHYTLTVRRNRMEAVEDDYCRQKSLCRAAC